MVLGVSYSSYANRDFTLATADTLPIRDVLVPVDDTLAPRGHQRPPVRGLLPGHAGLVGRAPPSTC